MWLEFNLPAAPERYADIARAFGVEGGGAAGDVAQRGLEFLRDLNRRVGIPAHMATLGVPESAHRPHGRFRAHRAAPAAAEPTHSHLQDARDIYRRAY